MCQHSWRIFVDTDHWVACGRPWWRDTAPAAVLLQLLLPWAVPRHRSNCISYTIQSYNPLCVLLDLQVSFDQDRQRKSDISSYECGNVLFWSSLFNLAITTYYWEQSRPRTNSMIPNTMTQNLGICGRWCGHHQLNDFSWRVRRLLLGPSQFFHWKPDASLSP